MNLILRFLSTASIPEGLVSMLLNQSNLLYDIYNYTHMIPELRLLIEQKLNQTTGITQKQEQQGNTTAKNCTEQQTESQPKGNELRVVTDAPGKAESQTSSRSHVSSVTIDRGTLGLSACTGVYCFEGLLYPGGLSHF